MVDILKTKGITAVMTQLTSEHERMASGDQGIHPSSTPGLLWCARGRRRAQSGRLRLKSRGMGHSNQVREYQITNKGIRLLDVPLRRRSAGRIGAAPGAGPPAEKITGQNEWQNGAETRLERTSRLEVPREIAMTDKTGSESPANPDIEIPSAAAADAEYVLRLYVSGKLRAPSWRSRTCAGFARSIFPSATRSRSSTSI